MSHEAKTTSPEEASCLQLGGITVEHRKDRFSIYGQEDITKDLEGLEKAKTLKVLVDSIVDQLLQAKDQLPAKIEILSDVPVKNPLA